MFVAEVRSDGVNGSSRRGKIGSTRLPDGFYQDKRSRLSKHRTRREIRRRVQEVQSRGRKSTTRLSKSLTDPRWNGHGKLHCYGGAGCWAAEHRSSEHCARSSERNTSTIKRSRRKRPLIGQAGTPPRRGKCTGPEDVSSSSRLRVTKVNTHSRDAEATFEPRTRASTRSSSFILASIVPEMMQLEHRLHATNRIDAPNCPYCEQTTDKKDGRTIESRKSRFNGRSIMMMVVCVDCMLMEPRIIGTVTRS